MSRASSSRDSPIWLATKSSRPMPRTWAMAVPPTRTATDRPIDLSGSVTAREL